MATETCAPPSSEAPGLFDTPVTLKLVEKKLREALNTSATFGPNVTVKQIAYGQGYLSVMVRLEPDWQGNKADELPTSFVVKIPSSVTVQKACKEINLDEMMKGLPTEGDKFADNHVMTIERVLKVAHAAETSFYEMVINEQLKLKVPQCLCVENYGSHGENGLLIMKDLSEIAEVKPLYAGLSVEAVKAVLDNLAEVHAYSLLHDQWLSNGNLKSTLFNCQKQSSDKMFGVTIGMMDLLKKDHPSFFDPLIDRLRDTCAKEFNLEYLDTLHEQLGLPPVLTHGDLWMSNMMWRKAADGKGTTDELVAIIDWQLVHPGCIGEDFVRLLCSSVDPDVRRKHLTEFMEFYHASLKSKLGKEPPFTVAQIIDAYKRIFRYGVVVLLACFVGSTQAALSQMGSENVEKNKNIILCRAKCLIEDIYEYEDELAGNN